MDWRILGEATLGVPSPMPDRCRLSAIPQGYWVLSQYRLEKLEVFPVWTAVSHTSEPGTAETWRVSACVLGLGHTHTHLRQFVTPSGTAARPTAGQVAEVAALPKPPQPSRARI